MILKIWGTVIAYLLMSPIWHWARGLNHVTAAMRPAMPFSNFHKSTFRTFTTGQCIPTLFAFSNLFSAVVKFQLDWKSCLKALVVMFFCLETLWNYYLRPGVGNLQPAKQNHPAYRPFTELNLIMHKFSSFNNINSKRNGIVGGKLVWLTIPCRACFWLVTKGKVVDSCIRLISNIIKPWNQGIGAGTNMQLLRLQLRSSLLSQCGSGSGAPWYHCSGSIG